VTFWQSVAEHYRKMASENGLLVTGGSDCHGAARRASLWASPDAL